MTKCVGRIFESRKMCILENILQKQKPYIIYKLQLNKFKHQSYTCLLYSSVHCKNLSV
jgi:hypothetical protein